MRIAVFGSGGVGGYFGGKLAQAGEDVTFIARGKHLEAIRQSGLKVESIKGDFSIVPAQAESDPQAVGTVDIVLVAVKTWHLPEIAPSILPLLHENTIVIPLLNGVEAHTQLGQVLGPEHVAAGLCHISTFIAAPGLIRHVAIEPHLAFNWADGRPDPRLDALLAAFLSVGVNAEIPADIEAALWNKFIFIASISGVGAVTRAPAGISRSIPETRQVLEAAIREVAAVGRRCGVALSPTIEDETLRFIDSIPPATTASMQRDIMEGRPSELEAQNGAVVRLGQAAGVPTPTHQFIYACLLPAEQRARGLLG